MTIEKKYLEQFIKIYTREVISQKELYDNYGICSILHLDLSFYYYTFEKEKEYYYNEKFNNKILLTDFNEFSVKIQDVIKILQNNNVDYTEYYGHFKLISWDENINNFKNGKIIITDKQHVMINCIIANAKFIAFTSNIPKNEGIMQTLNCKIPIMKSIEQFENELHKFLSGYYDNEFITLFRNTSLIKLDVKL
jgi:hypothetical protein